MDLDEIRAFLAVSKTGSFAAAAKETGFARATLRRRINELEARIGGELFDRSSDGATLTARGKVFAGRAGRVVAEAAALVSSARQVGEPVDDVFRLAIPREAPLDAAILGGPEIRTRVPRLRVHTTVCDDPVTRLAVDADAAVVFGDLQVRPPWRAVPSPPLLEGCFATDEYIERKGMPTTLEELAEHKILGWAHGDRPADELVLRAGGRIRLPVSASTDDVQLARQSVRTGRVIAYLWVSGLPSPAWYRNELVPVMPDVIGREVPAHLVVPAEIDRLPHARAILKTIEALVARARDGASA